MDKKIHNPECGEFSKCVKILNLILDNEATVEQETYVHEHIESCMVCFEQYELEKNIRDLIKTKLANMPVPEGLANQIRSKIQIFPHH